MRSIVCFLILTLLFVSCTETKSDSMVTPDSIVTNDSSKNIADTTIQRSKEISSLDTLTFDWFEFKKSVRFLNCGEYITSEKNRLSKTAPPLFLYEYCLYNGNQQNEHKVADLDESSTILNAIVLKTDGKIGQYGDRNEELLFLHVSAKHELLGVLNLVKQTKKEIITDFGTPDLDTLNNLIYINKPRVLILHYDNLLTISSLKYYLQFNPDRSPLIDLQNLQW